MNKKRNLLLVLIIMFLVVFCSCKKTEFIDNSSYGLTTYKDGQLIAPSFPDWEDCIILTVSSPELIEDFELGIFPSEEPDLNPNDEKMLDEVARKYIDMWAIKEGLPVIEKYEYTIIFP